MKWDTHNSQALQLDPGNRLPPRLLAPILDELRAAAATGMQERALVEQLAEWNGDHQLELRRHPVQPADLPDGPRSHGRRAGEVFFDSLLQPACSTGPCRA